VEIGWRECGMKYLEGRMVCDGVLEEKGGGGGFGG